MAICRSCGREMLKARGCIMKYVHTTSGRYVRRQKVGDEGWIQPGERCGDCGALYGNYHHPRCDIERCPLCGNQLISCDCSIDFLSTIDI